MEKLIELWKIRNEKEYEWFKNSILVISTMTGLIISLKDKSQADHTERVLFAITIILNGLCILVGLIFLYADTDTYHSLAERYKQHIMTRSSNEQTFLIQAAPKKIFSLLRKFFFFLLTTSIVSLITFAVYSYK